MSKGGLVVPQRRVDGMSAVEILVGAAIFASIAIPVLSMLYKSREAEQVSRFQYLAVLAARDEMYRARFLYAIGVPPTDIAHGMLPLIESPVRDLRDAYRTDPAQAGTTSAGVPPPPIPLYSAEQKRISLELKYPDEGATGGNERLKLATVTARWVDDTPGSTDRARKRPTSIDLVFGMLKQPGQR